MAVSITHSTPADGSFSSTGAIAWNTTHAISGLVADEILFANSSAVLSQSVNLNFTPDDQGTITLGSINGTPNFANILTPNGTNAQASPSIKIQTGDAISTFPSGNLDLRTGVGGTIGSAVGGDINIASGNGASRGGLINIFAGATTLNGAGAEAFIGAGDAASSGVGGRLTLSAGLAAGGLEDGRVNFTNNNNLYGLDNSTNTVLVTNVGPTQLTTSTIQKWLPIQVDYVTYYLPLWK